MNFGTGILNENRLFKLAFAAKSTTDDLVDQIDPVDPVDQVVTGDLDHSVMVTPIDFRVSHNSGSRSSSTTTDVGPSRSRISRIVSGH